MGGIFSIDWLPWQNNSILAISTKIFSLVIQNHCIAFQKMKVLSQYFHLLKCYTFVLYDKTSELDNVDIARIGLLCHSVNDGIYDAKNHSWHIH